MEDSNASITPFAGILHDLERGMALKKCRRCGCMAQALDEALTLFSQTEETGPNSPGRAVEQYLARMEPVAYDCYGCKKCWGAEATVKIGNMSGAATACSCGAEDNEKIKDKPAGNKTGRLPEPGDYLTGSPAGPVAVCTLSSRELSGPIVELGAPYVAIAGRCDTENIGVEKVVLNLLASPSVRYLVLCGIEARGHRAGEAFLQLKSRGVDANMRVLDSAAWRPVLSNLTLEQVARFREQVEVINLTGVTDPDVIVSAVKEVAARPVTPLPLYEENKAVIETVQAKMAGHLQLDPAGFFIVLADRETGIITCEHYKNNGRLANRIEGLQAETIASTVIEMGLITRLVHAAYLGRELAKAEIALKTGIAYEQDTALSERVGVESTKESCEVTSKCGCH